MIKVQLKAKARGEVVKVSRKKFKPLHNIIQIDGLPPDGIVEMGKEAYYNHGVHIARFLLNEKTDIKKFHHWTEAEEKDNIYFYEPVDPVDELDKPQITRNATFNCYA